MPKTMHPDVEKALSELGSHLFASRVAMGLRQSDVAEQAGVTIATIQRLERDGASSNISTLLSYLRVIGQFDAFWDAFARLDIPEDKRRIRHSSPRKFNTEAPMTGTKFLDFISRNPDAEAQVTPTAAVSLTKKGYAVRVEVAQDGSLTHYATSLEAARASKFEYQGPNGEIVGGNMRCRLTIAMSRLTEAQLGVVLFLGDELRTRMNVRIAEANLFVKLDEIELDEELDVHLLTDLDTGNIVNADPVTDILKHLLGKVTI